MVIKGARTIAEYRQIQAEKIQNWIDSKESWWNEVKDREIKEWNIIGGGMYKVELWIDLEE